MLNLPERNFGDIPEHLVSGAWAEKRRLAAALRDLCALCVTTEAPEDELRRATEAARALVASLAAHPASSFADRYAELDTLDAAAPYADRGTLVGLTNPYAPPLRFEGAGEAAIGRVAFGAPFEGIPGHVHGGLVAAAFDQLFGYVQTRLGKGSLTGWLTVRYKRPTPLLQELVFHGRVAKVEGKKTTLAGECRDANGVTAEAEALFIEVPAAALRERFRAKTEG
jgi:hypothetical protein